MLDTKGLFALEYSPREKNWRIEDLDVVLKRNLGWWAQGKAENGYIIVAIADSREELRDFSKSLVKRKVAMG